MFDGQTLLDSLQTSPLLRVWQTFLRAAGARRTFEASHWREALQMLRLWDRVCLQVYIQKTHAPAQPAETDHSRVQAV